MEDYSDNKGTETIKDRIERIPDIMAVKEAGFLPSANPGVLVQMTPNVLDVVVGADLRNDQWNVTPYCVDFRVWTCLAPRVKSDKNDNCGSCRRNLNLLLIRVLQMRGS